MYMEKRGIPKLLGFIILLSSIVFFLNTQSAHALLTLRLSDGTTTFDVSDGDVFGPEVDSSLASGVITYSGSIGNFDVVVSTGVQSGTNSLPILGINTFDVTSATGGGGTLTAWFSNTGFGPTSSPAGYTMHGSGTAIRGSGTVNFYSYIDNTNALFGEGTLLGSLGPYTSASYSEDKNGSISSLANPYALTSKTTVTLAAGSMMQTTTNVAIVPEPISSTLFVVGGALLGFRRFRKMKKA